MRHRLSAIIAASCVLLTAGAAAAQVTLTGSYSPATLPSGGGASTTVLTLTNNSGTAITGGAFTYVYPTNLNYNSAGFLGCGAIDTTGFSATQFQGANINLANGASCRVTVSGNVTVSGTYALAASSASYAGAAGSPVTLTPGTNPTLIVAAAGPAPVPTLSEWATILFGLMLAGGAAVYLQRRQFG